VVVYFVVPVKRDDTLDDDNGFSCTCRDCKREDSDGKGSCFGVRFRLGLYPGSHHKSRMPKRETLIFASFCSPDIDAIVWDRTKEKHITAPYGSSNKVDD
jgi:hypothetical protein